MQASLILEKNLKQETLLDLHVMDSACSDPISVSHLLEEEVKRIKKMGDQLINFLQAASLLSMVRQVPLQKDHPQTLLGAWETLWPLTFQSGVPWCNRSGCSLGSFSSVEQITNVIFAEKKIKPQKCIWRILLNLLVDFYILTVVTQGLV